jgi:hypothetical protein
MILPFVSEGLFDINPNFTIAGNDQVIVIDNWYLNYEDIHQILVNMPVARWKWVEGSRNFLDYYDCRSIFPLNSLGISQQGIFLIKDIIKKYYRLTSELEHINQIAEFNYFKNNKKNVSNNFQHFPHIDNYYNALIYLDKICSGGTAIYDMPSIVNTEQYNLLYDISNYSKRVIKAIPNRLVIFNGRQMHGGYIEDHNKYVNDWRFNQVLFFKQV